MNKLTKIAPGYYSSPLGNVRNIKSHSGAPHTRSSTAVWLVTMANGKPSYTVSKLSVARALLCPKTAA